MYESASFRNNAAELAGRVVGLLRGGRAGLVTDVDGTISPIVERPEQAIVLPGAREALARLANRLALVAVVSGRTVADAHKLVGVDGLTYVGNHGLEILSERGPELVPEARPWVPRIAAVLDDVARMHAIPGVLIENKGATASLHYRMTPDPDQARRELLAILARRAITSGLRIEEGRMVINLLPPLTVREHRLERLVYLGDDITDAHAFRALAVLRQSGVRTLGIGVVAPETPPSVRQLADACVVSVREVAELLCRTADGLESSGTMESREALASGEIDG